ncbi:MAG TPA: hypothetical protein PK447_02565 [Ignavibacteria bacterium]|nr:hypothetical protein [Ignavibacteria bacterium]
MEPKVISKRKLINKVKGYSTSTVGSLGEFLFKTIYNEYNPGSDFVNKHNDQTDFIVNKQYVDVKTRFKPSVGKLFRTKYVYNGKVQGVKYATVSFHKDCVAFYYKEESFFIIIDFNQLSSYFLKWQKGRTNNNEKNSQTSEHKYLDKYFAIVDDIKSHFKRMNLHFLYRSSTWNGTSNPGNFLPQKIKNGKAQIIPQDRFRIYIEFKSPKFDISGINKIIAYYEPFYKNLFTINPPTTKGLSNNLWYKIDLNNLPKEVLYESLQDFKQNFVKNHKLLKSKYSLR